MVWGTTVRNKRVPILGFMEIFATEDRDEELKTIWESMVLREYRMGDCHEEVVRPTKFSHFDRPMLFPLFFWSTRDHSSIYLSLCMRSICVS